jgi:hypothetical protein
MYHLELTPKPYKLKLLSYYSESIVKRIIRIVTTMKIFLKMGPTEVLPGQIQRMA